jgi:uncharacterized protein (DUF1501 family)
LRLTFENSLPGGIHFSQHNPSPLRAVSVGSQLHRTLRGERSAIAMNDSRQFQTGNEDAAAIIEQVYATTLDAKLGRTGKDAFAAMKTIRTINQQAYNPSNNAQYGQGGELGRGLQQIARLIKADVGVEAAFAEVGGWDHHGNENPQLSNLLRQFGSALAAFSTDMGDRMEDIVLVTMSEFGRTAQENGNDTSYVTAYGACARSLSKAGRTVPRP